MILKKIMLKVLFLAFPVLISFEMKIPEVANNEILVSWYGPGFHGRKTAFKEIYNMNDLTLASKELPHNTKVLLVYNDKKVIARVNDKGPYTKRKEIKFDLSKKTFSMLENPDTGIISIKYYVLN